MRIPPLLLRIRVEPARRPFTLWLPLFLLWPLVLLLAGPLFLLGLVLILAFEPRSTGRFLRSGATLYEMLCETRGTRVAVQGGSSQLFIAVH